MFSATVKCCESEAYNGLDGSPAGASSVQVVGWNWKPLRATDRIDGSQVVGGLAIRGDPPTTTSIREHRQTSLSTSKNVT
jgi:hypothetical protein